MAHFIQLFSRFYLSQLGFDRPGIDNNHFLTVSSLNLQKRVGAAANAFGKGDAAALAKGAGNGSKESRALFQGKANPLFFSLKNHLLTFRAKDKLARRRTKEFPIRLIWQRIIKPKLKADKNNKDN